MTAAKTHVSLNVSDVEKSVAFYEAFFGEKAHKIRPGYANFDLESPALKLALNESGAGIVTLDEGDTICCHARQDKVWVRDPDGNAWEIYVILDEMLEGAFEAPPKEALGCCTPQGGCCS